MKSIAIIPARGGSKRLPRKNIRPFMGRPMIHWTIESALQSKLFEIVLVSTDDEEIADYARIAGAEVPFLRKSNADDHSTVSDAVLTALLQAKDFYNCSFDVVAQLMPNCPLRGANEIVAAYTHFENSQHDFQISAFKFGWMNPWWAAKLLPGGQPDWIFPDARLSRSQDLQNLYCPTGAIWIADASRFEQVGTFYGPGHVLFPMDWRAAVDIDDAEDFQMAEVIGNLQILKER